MWGALNGLVSASFGVLLWPLSPLPTVVVLALLGLAAGVLALLVFRVASDQSAIADARAHIQAHLYELWIYRDDMRVSLGAQVDLLRENLRYLRHALVPTILMIGPFFLLLAQIEARFAFRALEPGEQALLTVETGNDPASSTAEVEIDAGVVAETAALRIRETGEVVWRIRALVPGEHRATLRIGEQQVETRIGVGARAAASPSSYRASSPLALLVPTAPTLPTDGPVRALHVTYPRARGEFLGLSSAGWSWLGFALLFGFLLRRPLGVAL